jgi:hypothetical protein
MKLASLLAGRKCSVTSPLTVALARGECVNKP